MDAYKADSLVWVNLGGLHGWWPATYQPLSLQPEKTPIPDLEIKDSRPEVSSASTSEFKPILGYARFFDDEKFDLYRIRDVKDIKPYSCPEKLSIIRNGLKKFEPKKQPKKRKRSKKTKKRSQTPEVIDGQTEKKKEGMFDLRARLAQFYKDVELAEVMTDNDPKVGDILLLYEIEGENGEPPCGELDEEEEDGVPSENQNPNTINEDGSRSKDIPTEVSCAKKKKKTA